MTKKIICLIISAAMLFILCACGNSAEKSKSADTTVTQTSARNNATIKLPYNPKDSLDPFVCESDVNHYLTTLLYDSLFKIDTGYNAVPAVASKYSAKNKTLTVNLKECLFSDGSSLTANDVVYSFRKAAASSYYSDSLKTFLSASAKGDYVIRFALSKYDAYAVNLLTFPIVSSKNEKLFSGKYCFDSSSNQSKLVLNENYREKNSTFEYVVLVECTDCSSAVTLLNENKIDYAFDLIETGNLRSTAVKTDVGITNNLIYIGINSQKKYLKNESFRQALSLCIDQENIAANAFQGYAFPTSTPFNPNWSEMGTIVVNSTKSNFGEAVKTLQSAGYKFDDMGIKLLDGSSQITLTLLVNTTNNMKLAAAEAIKNQLLNMGVNINIKKMPIDEYKVAVENGNYDIYIGEVKLLNDFNMECLFAGGSVSYGINSPKVESAYKSYIAGKAGIQDFVSVFSEENPIIPLCYKGVEICASASLNGSLKVIDNDFYANISDWSFE